MTRRHMFVLMTVAEITLAAAAASAAQVSTGTIVGTVRDADGVIPGAMVTIREVNRGTSNTYQTDETGSYTAAFLVPGTLRGRGHRAGVQ